MIGMKIDQAKGMFFDRKAVTSAADRAERRVLSRFGAFVRRGAKSGIRKRKRVSDPGKPPSSHTGLLKKFIFFAYEPRKSTVVIGPVRLNKSSSDAPSALEHGGTSRIVQRTRRAGKKSQTVRVRARPYMQPAFERELPKLPDLWRNSVR